MSAAHAQPTGSGGGGGAEPLAIPATPDESAALVTATVAEADGVAAAAAAWAKTDEYARAGGSPSVARTVAEYEQAAGDLYATAAGIARGAAANWAEAGSVTPQYTTEAASARYEQAAARSYERAAASAAKWSEGIAGLPGPSDRAAEARTAAGAARAAEEAANAAWARSFEAIDRQVEAEPEAMSRFDQFMEAEAQASSERLAAAERAAEAIAAAADGPGERARAAERAVAAERAAESDVAAFIRGIHAGGEWVPEADRIVAEFVPALESRDWDRATPLYERFAELGSDAIAHMAAGAASGRDAARAYEQAADEWSTAGNGERAADARERAAEIATAVERTMDRLSEVERTMADFDRRLAEIMDEEP